MKKLILLLSLILLFAQPSFAYKTEATAMTDLDIENPPETFTVKLNQNVILDDGSIIPVNSIVQNTVYNAKEAKRLKMKARLVIKVSQITEPNGKSYNVKNLYAKYTKLVDKVHVTKEAAVSVGNFFVKNITIPYHAVEGAIVNEEGNRAKSAVKGAYMASPLSYVEKGETINIKSGDQVYFEFGFYDPDNATVIDKVKYR